MYCCSPGPLGLSAPSPKGSSFNSSGSRRCSVTTKGSTAQQPRLSSSLAEADRAGLGTAELFKHFSLSNSTSAVQRRSSRDSSEQGHSVPITFGFSPSPTAAAGAAPSPFSQGAQEAAPAQHTSSRAQNSLQPRPAGLLSRALTQDEPNQGKQQLPSLPEHPSNGLMDAKREGSVYFPDVDATLLQDLQERHEVFHSELVSTAFMLASKAHAGRQRKDGSSMLSHCVLAALQLAEMGLDADTVAAGLLHEALGSSSNTSFRSQVEEFMPRSVISLMDRVQTITEISSLYRRNRGQLDEEKMRRMLLAMEDVKAMLIKLACRVHDMKSVTALPRESQLSLAQETLDIYSVVANRLGIWALKAELEDLAFAVLHPEAAQALRQQVAQRQDLDALTSTISTLKAALDRRGLKYEDLSGRPKSLYGIWCKMQSGGLTSLDQVYDVTALRVVVANKHDCYVALRVLQETYSTMPGRSKDYIKDMKKPNGYQSLHETVKGEGGLPVEVQIRTHKMHYIAEYGFAAHWKYKEKLSNEDVWLDKEVQYKKWLMTYKLGVHDKKVRASGTSQPDCALSSLGMHLLDGTTGSIDKAGVDPFLRHDRFKLAAPPKQRVSVMVATQDGAMDTRDLPVGASADQLSAELLGPQGLMGYVMTVNQRIPVPGALLHSGDLVQVIPVSAALLGVAGAPAAASKADRHAGDLQAQGPGQAALPGRGVAIAGRPQQLGSGCRSSAPQPAPGSSCPVPRAPPPAPGSVRRVPVYAGSASYSSGHAFPAHLNSTVPAAGLRLSAPVRVLPAASTVSPAVAAAQWDGA